MAWREIEPALAPRFAQGMYLPGEGQLDNRQLLASLAGEMERLGVQLHWNTPRELGYFGADQPGWLLDCRGLGARGDWSQLRGVRGEVIRLHAPEVTLAAPYATAAPTLSGLHRTQGNQCIRDRRDRDRV